MFWGPALGAFAVWLAYGAWEARRAAAWRAWAAGFPAGRALGLGALTLVGSVAVLFAGVFGLGAFGGFSRSGFTAPGALGLAAVGVAFVHLELRAIFLLASGASRSSR